jgi:hypothetical protein
MFIRRVCESAHSLGNVTGVTVTVLVGKRTAAVLLQRRRRIIECALFSLALVWHLGLGLVTTGRDLIRLADLHI